MGSSSMVWVTINVQTIWFLYVKVQYNHCKMICSTPSQASKRALSLFYVSFYQMDSSICVTLPKITDYWFSVYRGMKLPRSDLQGGKWCECGRQYISMETRKYSQLLFYFLWCTDSYIPVNVLDCCRQSFVLSLSLSFSAQMKLRPSPLMYQGTHGLTMQLRICINKYQKVKNLLQFITINNGRENKFVPNALLIWRAS
jgi:hypothetical protein